MVGRPRGEAEEEEEGKEVEEKKTIGSRVLRPHPLVLDLRRCLLRVESIEIKRRCLLLLLFLQEEEEEEEELPQVGAEVVVRLGRNLLLQVRRRSVACLCLLLLTQIRMQCPQMRGVVEGEEVVQVVVITIDTGAANAASLPRYRGLLHLLLHLLLLPPPPRRGGQMASVTAKRREKAEEIRIII